MDTPMPNQNSGHRWIESDSREDVTVEAYFDESEPNLPPQPIPPKHLAYLLEVKRLLEERERQRRQGEQQGQE